MCYFYIGAAFDIIDWRRFDIDGNHIDSWMNYEIWRWKEADDYDDDVDTAEDDVLFGVTFIGIVAQDNSTNMVTDELADENLCLRCNIK